MCRLNIIIPYSFNKIIFFKRVQQGINSFSIGHVPHQSSVLQCCVLCCVFVYTKGTIFKYNHGVDLDPCVSYKRSKFDVLTDTAKR